jgi:hypothetical protein
MNRILGIINSRRKIFMKIVIPLAALALSLFSCAQSENISTDSSSETSIDLRTVAALLDSIDEVDQKYREEMDPIVEEFGWDSDEARSLIDRMAQADSSNLVIVERILDEHGWLGPNEIGLNPNTTLFLVIQHAGLKTQEKYFPMITQAVEDGKAEASSLALLTDRIKSSKGELQVYGSQLGPDPETGELFVFPLIDPENVNKRREEVGLSKLETYLSTWNLEWDAEEHKKQMPKLMKLLDMYSKAVRDS